MTTFQVVCLLIGAVLLLSNVVDFRKLFTSNKPKTIDNGKKPDKVEVPVVDTPIPSEVAVIRRTVKKDDGTKKIWKVVKVWERLRDTCKDYGLRDSTAGLDQIFPTFLDFVAEKEKPNE